MIALFTCSSAMALTGDVSRDYEVERQLHQTQDRQPQSADHSQHNFVGPKLPDSHHQHFKEHSNHHEPGEHQGQEQ